MNIEWIVGKTYAGVSDGKPYVLAKIDKRRAGTEYCFEEPGANEDPYKSLCYYRTYHPEQKYLEVEDDTTFLY